MSWVANPWGIPGIVTGLVALAMAGAVYFTRPTRSQNRYLALILALEGIIAFTGTGLMFLSGSPHDAYGWQAVTVLALLIEVPLYLLFVGTLDAPWAAPLRRPAGRATLLVLMALAPLAWYVDRSWIVAGLVPVPFAPWEIVPGPGWSALILAIALVSIVGFAAALTALARTHRGTAARAQAWAFVVAFAFHDLAYAAFAFGPDVLGPTATMYLYALGQPTMQILFLPLLAYGILTTQLFDMHVRVKRGVARGILIGMFVVVFFAVSEAAERLVSDRAGPFVGLAAAGLLAIAAHPLQRIASRIADAAMPHAGEAGLGDRKLDVYRVAVEGALDDGRVTPRERAVLDRLRDKLGISASEAQAVEAEVASARG